MISLKPEEPKAVEAGTTRSQPRRRAGSRLPSGNGLSMLRASGKGRFSKRVQLTAARERYRRRRQNIVARSEAITGRLVRQPNGAAAPIRPPAVVPRDFLPSDRKLGISGSNRRRIIATRRRFPNSYCFIRKVLSANLLRRWAIRFPAGRSARRPSWEDFSGPGGDPLATPRPPQRSCVVAVRARRCFPWGRSIAGKPP